jgi:hypothetical protein
MDMRLVQLILFLVAKLELINQYSFISSFFVLYKHEMVNLQICAGKFWVERFKDGWEACTHKKAVAAALFTLFWNISSTTARVWAGIYYA